MVKDHLGNEYASVQKMCNEYPVKTSYSYNNRIKMGWSVEKALTTPVDEMQIAVDHLGNKYRSTRSMCAAYPVKDDKAYKRRIEKGWSIEEALMTPVSETFEIDHLGNKHKSLTAMCEAYPVTYTYLYYTRIKKGWSLKETLMTPPPKKTVTDHLGNEYNSVEEMCTVYAVDSSTYNKRLKKGYSQKDALTINGANHTTTDHLGNEYSSITEMCASYPVKTASLYYARINKGMNIKEALTTPTRATNKGKRKVSVDHLGNTFNSQKEMCEHYGISDGMFEKRIERGWPLEKALTTPSYGTSWKSVKDKDGNEYRNIHEACSTLGVTRGVLNRRIDENSEIKNWSTKATVYARTDGAGNTFPSKAEMCRHYNIPVKVFEKRVNELDMDVYMALTTPYEKLQTGKTSVQLGKKYKANNGCEFTVVDKKSYHETTVEFEDGANATTSCQNIKNGVVKHPTLKPYGNGSFAGFKTKNDHQNNGDMYYQCTCQTCGHKGVMTPKQMIEHEKTHK